MFEKMNERVVIGRQAQVCVARKVCSELEIGRWAPERTEPQCTAAEGWSMRIGNGLKNGCSRGVSRRRVEIGAEVCRLVRGFEIRDRDEVEEWCWEELSPLGPRARAHG